MIESQSGGYTRLLLPTGTLAALPLPRRARSGSATPPASLVALASEDLAKECFGAPAQHFEQDVAEPARHRLKEILQEKHGVIMVVMCAA